jgi:hypothetical protein
MTTATRSLVDKEWVREFRAKLVEPVSDDEKAQRRDFTRELRAFRDSLPSIAPDTTQDYVRQTREEEDARAW